MRTLSVFCYGENYKLNAKLFNVNLLLTKLSMNPSHPLREIVVDLKLRERSVRLDKRESYYPNSIINLSDIDFSPVKVMDTSEILVRLKLWMN